MLLRGFIQVLSDISCMPLFLCFHFLKVYLHFAFILSFLQLLWYAQDFTNIPYFRNSRSCKVCTAPKPKAMFFGITVTGFSGCSPVQLLYLSTRCQ